MASSSDDHDDDDFVILTCTNPNPIEAKSDSKHKDILISTADILSWDLSTILTSQTLQIHANRNRLVLCYSLFLYLSLLFENMFDFYV